MQDLYVINSRLGEPPLYKTLQLCSATALGADAPVTNAAALDFGT